MGDLNLQLLAETWQRMMRDPSNLVALTMGEADDFIAQVLNLVTVEDLFREFSVALTLELAHAASITSVVQMLEIGEKILRVSAVRKRLNEIAEVNDE